MTRTANTVLFTVCAAALGLAACQRQEAKPRPSLAVAARSEPTRLWRVEVMDGDKAVSVLDICADSSVRESFARPAPSVQGQPCLRVDEPVETGDTYSLRCKVGGQVYRVGAVIKGDRAKDFTVETDVAAQGAAGPTYEQIRRYALQGDCPAGWISGDSAAPGGKTIVNTLTGQTRLAGG